MPIWRVAGPDEALIISGLGVKGGGAENSTFRVVTGKRVMVVPGLQICHRLSLALRVSDLEVTCVTAQGIKVRVRGEVACGVGAGSSAIAKAAVRFLDQEEMIDDAAHRLLADRLRSAVGGLTAEELLGGRHRLADQVRTSAADEMGALGLVVDSFQIKHIERCAGEAGAE